MASWVEAVSKANKSCIELVEIIQHPISSEQKKAIITIAF
jgi:hypothetical protein